jgi:hypothetical protein
MKYKDTMFQEQKDLYMTKPQRITQYQLENHLLTFTSAGGYTSDLLVSDTAARFGIPEEEVRNVLVSLINRKMRYIDNNWIVRPVEQSKTQSSEKEDFDPVNKPKHYASGKIQPIEAIEDWGLGYNLGNCIKYLSRAGKKDKTKEKEDLQKALFYLSREIANLDKKK